MALASASRRAVSCVGAHIKRSAPRVAARSFASDVDAAKRTALYDSHVELGGKMVEFAGYALPVQYPEGVLKSHLHTREKGKASLFDVSHMGQVTVHGADRAAFLETVVVADLRALEERNATLSLITNENGGIIDDTIITNAGDHIGMVVNGACKEGDLEHLQAHAAEFRGKGGDVTIVHHEEQQLLALQGDGAAKALQGLVSEDLSKVGFMQGYDMEVAGYKCGVMRCGYTGEDGFEISMSWDDAPKVMAALLEPDFVWPAALGPRDSLRLEAGMCLYGHDIDDTVSPIEAALNWVISKRRRAEGGFLGAETVQDHLANGVSKKRVGFGLKGKAPAREGVKIFSEDGSTEIGVVTSGTFSPILKRPISMGYVAKGHWKLGTPVKMEIRGKLMDAVVEKMPFVPNNYYKPS